MSTNGRKRARAVRVPLELAPNHWVRIGNELRKSEVILRLTLGGIAALALWASIRAWAPPFEFHEQDVPARDVVARVDFQVPVVTTQAAGDGQLQQFTAGTLLAKAGEPLPAERVKVLRYEYEASLAAAPSQALAQRSLAVLALILGIEAFCAYYIYVRDPRIIRQLRRLSTLLVLSCLTVLLARWTGRDPWRAELIPLLLFGMTAAIAYQRELAIVLSVGLSIVMAAGSGHSLGEFLLLAGTVSTVVLQTRHIRTRRKLILVGVLSSVVAFALALGVGMLEGRLIDESLLFFAARNALWTVLAGFLITGLLPFIENLFGVLTEISLLELGDVAHPLLQELVRRAPGTYNHSINVASLAEAAADSIGASGLLVRVGAYFHDIGKMLKPDYFVENQSSEASRHDTLVPAMSTLIIIAHIKDGADLARQHHLPDPIIDFIEQHHGTTLVEYFYHRANAQNEANPDARDIPESSFRYPGPKPQTVEAAVLMVADAVESASRALVEPTPSRIENLVESIAMKKLVDGQFDECGLTFKQLRAVQDSLIKSLSAVYHGRVKYPGQRTA